MPIPAEYKPVRIVWNRFGKEHERQDPQPPLIRINPPEMGVRRIEQRLADYSREPEEHWRMWQVSSTLLVERAPLPHASWARDDTFFYYLLDQGMAVMDGFYSRRFGRVVYIHICDYAYSQAWQAWVMTDLFTDVLVSGSGQLLAVLDLDDLADARELGLISPERTDCILRLTQSVVDRILNGEYPFTELQPGFEAVSRLGWKNGDGTAAGGVKNG